jgi:hypothetical protein
MVGLPHPQSEAQEKVCTSDKPAFFATALDGETAVLSVCRISAELPAKLGPVRIP